MTLEDFTIALSGQTASKDTVNVDPGHTASYSLTMSPVGGATLASDVDLAVSGLPTNAVAHFSQATVKANSGVTQINLDVTPPAHRAKLSSRRSARAFASARLRSAVPALRTQNPPRLALAVPVFMRDHRSDALVEFDGMRRNLHAEGVQPDDYGHCGRPVSLYVSEADRQVEQRVESRTSTSRGDGPDVEKQAKTSAATRAAHQSRSEILQPHSNLSRNLHPRNADASSAPRVCIPWMQVPGRIGMRRENFRPGLMCGASGGRRLRLLFDVGAVAARGRGAALTRCST